MKENAKPAENGVQAERRPSQVARENAKLSQENADLLRENEGLEAENQKLTAKSRELEDQIQHLIKDIDRILDDNERLGVDAARVQQLEAKNARLLSEFTGEGRLDKGSLRLAHIMELEGKIAKLASENAQLNSKVLRLSTQVDASGKPLADGSPESIMVQEETAADVHANTSATALASCSPAEPLPTGGFSEGDRVKLAGLKGMSYLNGQCGILSTFSTTGRWRVHLVDGQAKDVKPDNLTNAAETECDWAKLEVSLRKPWEAKSGPEDAESQGAPDAGVFGGFTFLGDVFRGDQMKVGATVVVKASFKSNSKIPVRLHIGQTGVVKHLDSDGDAEIDFKDHPSIQWVFRKHFDKLAIRSDTQTEVKSEEPQSFGDFFGFLWGNAESSAPATSGDSVDRHRRPSIASQHSDADSMMSCETQSWTTCQEQDDEEIQH